MRLVEVGDIELEVYDVGTGDPVVLVQTALTADELGAAGRTNATLLDTASRIVKITLAYPARLTTKLTTSRRELSVA
jgi:hypothetical protein